MLDIFKTKMFSLPLSAKINYYVGGFYDCYRSETFEQLYHYIFKCGNTYYLLRDSNSRVLERIIFVTNDTIYDKVISNRLCYCDLRGLNVYSSLSDDIDNLIKELFEVFEKSFKDFLEDLEKNDKE